MTVVVRADYSDAFQLDVSGEWDVEEQLGIAIGLHELLEIQSLFVRFENIFSRLLLRLVQHLQVVEIDLLVQRVLQAHLERVDSVCFMRAGAFMVVRMRHSRI